MKSHSVFAAALVLAAAVTAQAQTVKVEFLMGKVNLTAQNASVRTIINEWARVGGARVVNPERLSAVPVTLQLTGVPERQALDILLRDVGGYMLGPRQTELVPGVSAFDRLMVVTATAGPAPRPAPAGSFNQVQRPATQSPPFRRPPAAAPPEPEGESEPISEPQPDEPGQGGVPNRQNVRPAVMPPLPQAEVPPPTPAPAPTPGNPFGAQGVSRPGIITPVPQPTPPQQRPPNE
jgi:hypothetical protein